MSLLRLLHSPSRILTLNIAFIVLSYLLISRLSRSNPVSDFFETDESTYASPHSDWRKERGRAWVEGVERSILPALGHSQGGAQDPTFVGGKGLLTKGGAQANLSVVLLTALRSGPSTLDTAVGSLLEPLTPVQRSRVRITALIVDDESTRNPAWNWPWLHLAVDEIWVRKEPPRVGGDDTATTASYVRPGGIVDSNPFAASVKTSAFPGYPFAMPTHLSEGERKASMDYRSALSICQAAYHPSTPGAAAVAGREGIQTPHCLVLEDDTVAAEDWFQRLETHIAQAEKGDWKDVPSVKGKMTLQRDRRAGTGWAFIRTFWAEQYFGWEDTEVRGIAFFLLSSTALFFASSLALVHFASRRRGASTRRSSSLRGLEARDRQPYSPVSTRSSSPSEKFSRRSAAKGFRLPPLSLLLSLLSLSVTFLVLQLLVIFSGRSNVLPVPRGLSYMPERGCCTQGILYPSSALGSLGAFLDTHAGSKPYDILISDWATGRTKGLLRRTPGAELVDCDAPGSKRAKEIEEQYTSKGKDKPREALCEKGYGPILAIRPSLLQHVGATSSMGHARRKPLWSFDFERGWRKGARK